MCVKKLGFYDYELFIAKKQTKREKIPSDMDAEVA
jgi:transposase, IS5 family